MDIDLLSADRLRISLSGQDVKSLDIDLSGSASAREKSRRFFAGLLSAGKRETGFSPKGAKVYVELYPDGDGGFVIYFTAYDKARYPRRNAVLEPVVFAFSGADALCDGVVGLYRLYGHRIYKSSLYRYKGIFTLIVYPLDYSDRLSVYFLSEYGERAGEGEVLAAHIAEFGSEIIRDNAIDELGGAFGYEALKSKGLL